MSNVAILLGVSVYEDAKDLPACKNDVESMYQLLQATGKYSILKLPQDITKSNLIDRIDDFLRSTDEQLGEILFYFSGHGCRDDTDLHYILKNSEMGKINTTSLNNTELDDLIREYDPQLFVKVIDASQSGFHYIKAIDSDKNNSLHIKDNKAFANCIFMSSSRSNESSMATDKCSLFTKAFISAVLDGTSTDIIRYSDIQNYITDVFKADRYAQTPFFTLQCDGRASFTKVTDQLKALANTWLQKVENDLEIKVETEIKLDKFLNAYRAEEKVKDIVDKIKDVLGQEKLPLSWLEKYYDINLLSTPQKDDFKEDVDIVNYLYERADKENLYVEFETKTVEKENVFGIPMFGYKTIPYRFSIVAKSLPANIRIDLLPKNKALPRYEIELVFIYSDTGMYIFQGAKQFIRKGWDKYVLGDKKKYSCKRLEYLKFDEEDWREFVHQQFENSVRFVEASLDDFVGYVT